MKQGTMRLSTLTKTVRQLIYHFRKPFISAVVCQDGRVVLARIVEISLMISPQKYRHLPEKRGR